ncbi:MAG: hypothetical protein PVF37_22860 [Desulfobacterales bacterium]
MRMVLERAYDQPFWWPLIYNKFIFQPFSAHVVKEITKDIQTWADKAEGKIRFFGFFTHKNMENCLTDAARLGWIDGIMATYNYRLMQVNYFKAEQTCSQKMPIAQLMREAVTKLEVAFG